MTSATGVGLRDEREFTPFAEAGWLSWDAYSPEEDFCRFVATMQRILGPATTLETGVGVGRVSQHLDLRSGGYLGFESDPRWRQPPADPTDRTPSAEQMRSADLVILDSAPSFRLVEIALWAEHGRPGSVCVVHDCGNGHAERTTHHRIRRAVETTGLPGIFLGNPRGGWLGWHP